MSNDFVDLMRARKYSTILELPIMHSVRHVPGHDGIYLSGAATALLRNGDYQKAISMLGEIIELEKKNLVPDTVYNEMGAIYWIRSEIAMAIGSWQQALKCQYGDGAQNMTPTMLLYYAAVRTNDDGLKGKAIEQIEKKLRTGWAKNWPAPLGRFLIGVEGEEHVEQQIARQHPKREPDERCRFNFYKGVKCLESGDEAACLTWMKAAVDVPEQVTWTTEFVLAQHESTQTES